MKRLYIISITVESEISFNVILFCNFRKEVSRLFQSNLKRFIKIFSRFFFMTSFMKQTDFLLIDFISHSMTQLCAQLSSNGTSLCVIRSLLRRKNGKISAPLPYLLDHSNSHWCFVAFPASYLLGKNSLHVNFSKSVRSIYHLIDSHFARGRFRRF